MLLPLASVTSSGKWDPCLSLGIAVRQVVRIFSQPLPVLRVRGSKGLAVDSSDLKTVVPGAPKSPLLPCPPHAPHPLAGVGSDPCSRPLGAMQSPVYCLWAWRDADLRRAVGGASTWPSPVGTPVLASRGLLGARDWRRPQGPGSSRPTCREALAGLHQTSCLTGTRRMFEL